MLYLLSDMAHWHNNKGVSIVHDLATSQQSLKQTEEGSLT